MTFSSKAFATCALAILLSIGMLSYRSTVQDEEDRGWVTHTHLVLEKLQAVLIDVTEAETSQRGFILTGEEKYLEPYRAGIDQVQRDIGEVQRLTADNPRQQEAIKGLNPVVDTRLTLLAGLIEIRRRSGLMAGAEAVAKGNSEELMNEIRERIGEMRSTEERLLKIRLETATTGTRKMKAVIVLGNGLAILILSVAGMVIRREAGRRNLAERELKHVNEHLEHRTAELSDANSELESFSYSVAHDLRAPLRQIAGYSNVLIQDYGPQLDAEARRYLEKVEDGARKMGRLVDDLLSLSKIGRQELALQATPLDSILRQVVEDLAPECSGREVEWQIGSLFSAECDPGLMKQVFVNLLSNAVKYTGKRERAVIQVGQMTQNDQRVIFVRDNGAGFEMQYVGKLFGVFQRLHKARDFEGTGVGLAIVQRIIRKHGGRIWADAKLDHGATFFFTLGSPENNTNNNPERLIRNEVIHVARS
ncbi:MAG TPA: CHASE3 domain-containing protein [Candidatus Acidoferrum sp.]|jgi:signal transduction histidine kinase|nr:CHASE3 domain-containing protein [Candidatus Acidoferrum sp.]